MSAGPAICPGDHNQGCIWPHSHLGHESLFYHHVLKFIRIELGKSPLPGGVDLLMTRELELGPAERFNHMLLVLQPGADGHYVLANVDPGHCALGLSKGAAHTCLESRLRNSRPVMMPTRKSCPQGPSGLPVQATGCIHYQGSSSFFHVSVNTNSSFLGATPLQGKTTQHVITHLSTYFAIMRTPNSIKTDNAPAYISKQFKQFLHSFSIEQITDIPYSPQAQDIIKQTHHTR